jgi:hypothetical protein
LKIEAFLMSTPRTIRMIRVRRAAALSVAAVAVVLGPTACDSASAGDSSGYGAGHSQHGTEVVTVANERADEDGDIRNGREGGDRGDREDRDREGREGRDGDSGDRGPGPEENAAADEDAPGEEDPAALQEADDEGDAEAAAEEFNGLEILGNNCDASDRDPHTGFQEGDKCVSTAFGEVGPAGDNPSLLITEFPETVGVNEPFEIKVVTRNLVRDRFLGAADGGYYLESSFLNGEGLQRGHFHTACRIIDAEPPSPDPDPEFFLATQDNEGGRGPDEVVIEVPGIDTAGQIQCSSWAGDGSHRIPMMERANQTPAFDSVRITVE